MENAERIKKKFSDKRVEAIKSHYREKVISLCNQELKYRKHYIATEVSKKTIDYLEKEEFEKQFSIQVEPLYVFIKEKIIPLINNWKSRTFPESMWLMKFLDYYNTNQCKK